MYRSIYALTMAIMLFCTTDTRAQNFFNLTADEVRIDSMLPCFTYSHELGYDYDRSTYEVTIEYPEFMPMTEAERVRYSRITRDSLPTMPVVDSHMTVERKRGVLDISFVPLAMNDGVPSKLVSFKLGIKAVPKTAARAAARAENVPAGRYADNSVLATGRWAKIRVAQSGVYQLTDAFIKKCGFTSLDKVKIYGYGGALVPEKLSGDYLKETDDLKQVATCKVDGKRLFHAQGPVSWTEDNDRIRNPYSQYGHYFLTENEDSTFTIGEEEFVNSFYPNADFNNTLYEVDDYAWYTGGRNLFDARLIETGAPAEYTMASTPNSASGTVRVAITANAYSTIRISVNDSIAGQMNIPAITSSYDKATINTATFRLKNIKAGNKVTVEKVSGGNVRLDYIVLHNDNARPAPDLHGSFDTPEYMYHITNQNHHADEPVDMVIIIPTSQKNRSEAERLKALHEKYDSMTVRIVPADELFNEFSSGTPDASAYRRYMKMFYDRAADDSQIPGYLLLFGDGAWDNRMLIPDWKGYSPDDFLLCFESENSFSSTKCFVSDDFFGLLDDGETISEQRGTDTYYRGKPDIAIGRFPVRGTGQAKVMVDKIESYMKNDNAGAWQNTLVFMGDDGNNNIHMEDADEAAKMVERICPSFDIKRVMWDSYERTASATGFAYPDVSNIIKKYMNAGSLMMNYSGHGSPYTISHEIVVSLNDFANAQGKCLPLWFTASCDVMPFDGQESTIGETAVLNDKGGAVAFFGTTRTVYSQQNRMMNLAFTKRVADPAKRMSIGEAVRQAKNQMVTSNEDLSINKLHYVLLGDPAMKLALPNRKAVIDSINGVAVNSADKHVMKAGERVKVSGHIENADTVASDFEGTMTAIVSDAKKKIYCRLNNTGDDGAEEPFVYEDYSGTVYKGTDSIHGGRFEFTFVVPKDINYSDGACDIRIHAVNSDKTRTAAGNTDRLVLNGSSEFKTDSIGPSIYCYLNSSSFTNGDAVNSTPYFIAEIHDEDGINAAGNGIGHDLQLIIDGDMAKTYSLNDNFTFDFGSYKSGTVGFSIPQLSVGKHTLKFRAWDVLNNSSTSELSFTVTNGAAPTLFDVECTKNPATTSTSFRVIHDRIGAELKVMFEFFDMSGRLLGTHTTTGTAADNTFTVDWDLTVNSGAKLGTGVYLYRANISSEGGDYSSKTKKLIVINNN